MSNKKVQKLLKQLQKEIKSPDTELDEQTAQQLQELDVELYQIMNKKELEHQELNDLVLKLEHDFKSNYPVASNILQEMINILSKAGI
jgi:hypothetical protein